MPRFPSLKVEGGLLGSDLVEQIFAGEAEGQRPQDFRLTDMANLSDYFAFLWNRTRELWDEFQTRLEQLSPEDTATTLTRERFVIPLLKLLEYDPTYQREAVDIDGRKFPLSHRADSNEDAPFVHIVGIRQSLDRRPETGVTRMAPHALVQEFLNKTEHLWAIVTNGAVWRLLRDSQYLARQAYIEFNLQEMLANELFADFQIFVRLIHRTRLPKTVADAPECLLERYYRQTVEQGNRVRDKLRDGVEKALTILGTALLAHPKNEALKQKVRNEKLKPEGFYQQLLRLIYRLLFLLVAEERNLIATGENNVYRNYYSVSRLRRLTEVKSAWSERHCDLWLGLQKTFSLFSNERYAKMVGIAPLNGELFAPSRTEDLQGTFVTNADLLKALWYLCWFKPDDRSPWQRVNYAQLDVEELGSIYESLLDYRPSFKNEGGKWEFELAPAGLERKSTGSYYTPRELVGELIKSALEPVLQERLEQARRMANSEWRMVCGEWRMVKEELARKVMDYEGGILSRLGSLEKGDVHSKSDLPSDSQFPERRSLRTDISDETGSSFHTSEHSRRLGQTIHGRVHPIPSDSQWEQSRVGDSSAPFSASENVPREPSISDPSGTSSTRQTTGHSGTLPEPSSKILTEDKIAQIWTNLPFATRHSLLAEQAILSIKVLDPACGSGHFLLAAARRLAKELAKIRTGEEEPPPTEYRMALRDVVRHCIYGVDKNPLAVELCKVALWIESHAEGKPLTFLDHKIKCGDSLVGVFDLDALKEGIPDEAFEAVAGDDKKVASLLKQRNRNERKNKAQYVLPLEGIPQTIAQAIRKISEIPDDEPDQVREKERQYGELQRDPNWQRMKTLCDLWTAAFFAELKPENMQRIPTSSTIFNFMRSQGAVRGDIIGYAWELAKHHRFFHWAIEFPDVFWANSEWQMANSERQMANSVQESKPFATNHSPFATNHSPLAGFDVVLSNPPFLGGLRISGTLGDKYRHYLVTLYEPFKGTADLCAAFYRRAFKFLKPNGMLGMVATNTIGQGDTRESGLAVIIRNNGTITFARRFIKWPGAANVEVNLIAIRKGKWQKERSLDRQSVDFISSRLDSDPEAEPKRLSQNEGKAFIGDYVRGIGFVLEPREAERLFAKDSRNADCLFPYLNGEDLNSHPEQKPSRWVICFHNWDLEQAKQYPDLLRIVEERVKPEREKLRDGVSGYDRLKQCWWQFGAYAKELRRAIAPMQRVLVGCIVTQYWAPTFVENGWVYAHRIVVFAFSDDYHFALLQSNVHEIWARKYSSTLEERLNYSPTDCFDTFPFPPAEYEVGGDLERLLAMQPFSDAARIGSEYHEHRRQIMLNRQIGLTKTYNLFHNPTCTDADIVRLRELHAEMDRTILCCYGWDDIDPQHDFYQNERGQTRFTVSPQARREILHRLYELNEKIALRESAIYFGSKK